MTETRETRVKRLRMRSMRRGIKEMDMILSAFADHALAEMQDGDLDVYETLLGENDHDIYAWVSGRDMPPDHYKELLGMIRQVFQIQA